MILKNKLKGILFGQAIGDALGLGCEFLTRTEIQEHYPNGFSSYKQIIQDEHRQRWKIGDWTDDTDQFLCILDSFLENDKTIIPKDIASRIYQWFSNQGMGIGMHTYQVLTRPGYTEKPFESSETVWNLSNKHSAPNGGLMRNSANVLLNPLDLEKSIKSSKDACRITHFDFRCVDSCVIHTSLLHALINNQHLSYQEIIDSSEILDNRTIKYINETLSPNIETLCLDLEYGLGYTLKALCTALWAYTYATSFEEGLLMVVNQGGDADTNGCIAGSILGAKFGYDSIPKNWINGLRKKEALEERFGKLMETISI